MGSLTVLGEALQYPHALRDESVVDDYFGVKISDPYRWLEDPDSEETKEFVQNQVKLTQMVLNTCDSRQKLHDKITKLFDHPRYDTPFRRGSKFFYSHNTGLQAQSVLYMQDSLDAQAEVLLDPNVLSEDGTVALNMLSVSKDAKYLAYALSSSGSDWVTIRVMRIEDKEVEADTLSWVKFSSISWTQDNRGFFYGRYPTPKFLFHFPFLLDYKKMLKSRIRVFKSLLSLSQCHLAKLGQTPVSMPMEAMFLLRACGNMLHMFSKRVFFLLLLKGKY